MVIVVRFFLTMPQVCLQFVIVVFPDHTHLFYCSADADEMLRSWVSHRKLHCLSKCRLQFSNQEFLKTNLIKSKTNAKIRATCFCSLIAVFTSMPKN